MDKLLNLAIEKKGAKSTNMDVKELNPLVTSLRTLKTSKVEQFPDNYKGTGDIYDFPKFWYL